MKAAELRQSILQAAVQGKLVPQNVHDESASELFKRIRQEKARLVKEGKIKKEKPLPPITEDDVPYDLPDGWVWCRLNDVCAVITDGDHQPPPKEENGVPFLVISNISKGHFDFSNTRYVSEEYYSKLSPEKIAGKGDILFTVTGSFGIPVVVKDNRQFCFQRHIALIRPVQNTDLDYVHGFLLSPVCFMQCMRIATGTAQKTVPLSGLRNLLFPLPPLAEQQRIVAKVDELMAMCDELEAAEKELDTLEKRFEDYLPKSILQAAVQGKLVPQNVHDEPASELLKRIQQEKARLVKEGKIKKEKLLPPIAEDEIPYDLPDGWTWCRLANIMHDNIGGGTPSKQNSDYWGGNIHWASVKDLNCDILTTTIDTITEKGLLESSSNLIPENSIIVCTRMGLGKIVINHIPVAINQDLRALLMPKNKINYQYFVYWYKTLSIVGGGMTVKGVKIEELENMPFPLPPLAEQQRIVAKVDDLMALCDELKAAKVFAVKSMASNVVPFPQQGEDDELLMVAQGEVSGKVSKELKQAQEDLFGDGADE